ncbi:hypothetical protein J6590_000762 [Homalodisca vitripennis]|nr:hypothetical protein J6590_000762 [Homalodisca vitripennis]
MFPTKYGYKQAELVSVAGKDTDNHYVLAKEPILKWNSSSSCYLLIEGMERTLEPTDVAKATILSSCPCDHDLHYVITTEGHVTYWSQSEASTEDQNPPSVAIDGAAICRMNFSSSLLTNFHVVQFCVAATAFSHHTWPSKHVPKRQPKVPSFRTSHLRYPISKDTDLNEQKEFVPAA